MSTGSHSGDHIRKCLDSLYAKISTHSVGACNGPTSERQADLGGLSNGFRLRTQCFLHLLLPVFETPSFNYILSRQPLEQILDGSPLHLKVMIFSNIHVTPPSSAIALRLALATWSWVGARSSRTYPFHRPLRLWDHMLCQYVAKSISSSGIAVFN